VLLRADKLIERLLPLWGSSFYYSVSTSWPYGTGARIHCWD
jgi:hypothetical protein